jgi:dipeptidyl-peptidase-3
VGVLLGLGLLACKPEPAAEPAAGEPVEQTSAAPTPEPPSKPWVVDRFADVQILRYEVPGFAELDLQRKQLIYYLYEAALAGRDITYDQKFAGNLAVRRTLEAILIGHAGKRETPEWLALHGYAKRVWFSNGIHHHDSGRKLEPGFSRAWFEATVRSLDPTTLPLREGQTVEALLAELRESIFDPKFEAKRTNRDDGADAVADSANNFYGEGLTAAEVVAYYAASVL